MDLVCYERDQGFVLARFREGEFDYLDAASEVVETEFFRYLGAQQLLRDLAATYPTPRQKAEVPLWLYLASNLSLRLHGVQSFHAYPYVVRCGGMLNAFGPTVAAKVTHPDTGDVTLRCAGFNAKNSYDRQTPCDQDFLRKLARDTEAVALQTWYNRDVARVLHRHQAFDPEGLFIGDASYLFVPDNPAYEGSVRLLFDAHGHPVEAASLASLTPQEAARCQWRRCYKLVSLLHTDRPGSFFYRVAVRVLPGAASECPVLYTLVDDFVAAVGPGILRRLILDRGFLDGAAIGRCKQAHGIDVLIPVRQNMAIYQDALGLLRLPEVVFTPYQPPPRGHWSPPGRGPPLSPCASGRRSARRPSRPARRVRPRRRRGRRWCAPRSPGSMASRAGRVAPCRWPSWSAGRSMAMGTRTSGCSWTRSPSGRQTPPPAGTSTTCAPPSRRATGSSSVSGT
ncbi:MAG: transposase [candidate division NC10 bacterium]|nr:transposase [candidate division NC10 bacterium]MBI3122030.1 transposase [candidate division NC10 bacterium]